MLQPRCRGSLRDPLLLAGIGVNARAGHSKYRFLTSPSGPRAPSVHCSRRHFQTQFRTHSSSSQTRLPSTPPSPPFKYQYASAALTAAPVASSPIPDTVTQILLGSPLSPGWTIILLTLFCRSTITLPMTLWQRRRLTRTRQLVIPQMKAYNEFIALSLVRESRAAGKTYEEYRKALKDKLATYQRELHRKYKTHPLPTMLVPLGVHIPLLIGLSLTIRKTVEMPGGWGESSFWWLDKLGEVDSTGVLPIVGGLVAFANAEVVGRKVKTLEEASTVSDTPPAATSSSPMSNDEIVSGSVEEIKAAPASSPPSLSARAPKRTALPSHLSRRDQTRDLYTSAVRPALPRPRPKRAHQAPSALPPSTPTGPIPDKPRLTTMESPEAISAEKRKAEVRTRFISNVMRIGAVLFIPIAAQVPSALALYWTVSMGFTFVQNLFLNRLDAREASRLP